MTEMREEPNLGRMEDSLERIERVMAIEEALIRVDPLLTPDQLEWLIQEIEARTSRAQSGDQDDFDDDDLLTLVRNVGPRTPRGHSCAAVRPEDVFLG